MNEMIQGPFCRAQMADLFGLKGKDLTAKISTEIRGGGLMRAMVFVDPAHSPKKRVAFWFTAKTADLFAGELPTVDFGDLK